ncbi:MAG: hypothetical protein JXR40_14310, partial [Pontiellaceae bacterium]|nr:hypothetical protein [Pontiellaceae bacterium]
VVWLNPPSVRYTNYNARLSSLQDGIDLNSDGKIDLKFSYSYLTTGDGFGAELLDVRSYDCDICLTPLAAETPINSTNNWVDSKYPLTLASRSVMFGPYTGGPWANATNAYLAVKLKSEDSVNYGWISLIQSKDTISGIELNSISFKINDGAYESVENGEILAGQTE